ncbi:MAG: hypothetical protein LBG94_00800 [Treponema sp.]|jgi:hypothetical protein|nr:hypothetical protein [Treponema sp.]
MDEKVLYEKLDRIIMLLERANKEPSLIKRIVDGSATGVGILGIIAIIETIRTWLGG